MEGKQKELVIKEEKEHWRGDMKRQGLHNEGAMLSVPSYVDVFLFPIFHSLQFKLKSLKRFCLFCTMTCRECTSDILNIPPAQLSLSQNVNSKFISTPVHWVRKQTVFSNSVFQYYKLIRLPKCDFDLSVKYERGLCSLPLWVYIYAWSLCTAERSVAMSLLWDRCFASVFHVLYIWTSMYIHVNPKPKQ